LGEEGKQSNRTGYILKELDDLDLQAKQLRSEIETMEFEINDMQNKIVGADVIRKFQGL
jgi:TolA-binding protein